MGGYPRTVVTKTRAPDWAEDIFRNAASKAADLYNQGVGGNSYQGQRVSDLSKQTQNAMNGLEKTVQDYQHQGNANGYLNQPTQAEINLSDMASGKYLTQGNPYFQQRLHQMVHDSNDLIQSQVAGLGRYGSAADTNALARNTQNIMLSGLNEDYNRALNNMQSANQQIDAARRDQTNMRNDWYRGQGNAQKDAFMGGRILDDHQQKKIDAEQAAWHEKDNEAWKKLKMLLETGRAAVGNAGTTQMMEQESSLDQFRKIAALLKPFLA